MPAPLIVISAWEIISPFLIRIGLTRWFNFAALRTMLQSVTVSIANLATWARAWMAANPKLTAGFLYLVALIMDFAHEYVEDLEKYEGNVKLWIIDKVQIIICSALNEAILEATGVVTEIDRIYPPNDPEVLEAFFHEIGKVIAYKLNQRFGTTFGSVYPVQEFGDNVKNTLISELQSGTRRFLSQSDVNSFVDALKKQYDSLQLNQAVAGGGIAIAQGATIAEQLARRRAAGRERSRKYALTHKRVSHAWTTK